MAATMVAAAMATPPVITRLGVSSLSSPRASLSKVQLSSEPDDHPPNGAAFRTGDRSTFMTPLQLDRPSCMSRIMCFNRDWLCKDLSVVGLGLIGWIAPSSIPVINGNSLTGKAKDAGGQNERSSCNRAAE
ncbi:hypothetical protein CY35_10G089700 [Sphagnum magellanicum]|nr:hypothetical protein CY35_10G089700 [Sphagnum magellanicum]